MADIFHMRARRFDALHQLLTGVTHAELPTPFDGSDHLRKDTGLPEQKWSRFDAAPFGLFPFNPFRHALQGRPEQ